MVVAYLNLIFGDSKESEKFWDKPLKKLLRKQFLDCLLSLPTHSNLKAIVMNIKIDMVDENENLVEVNGLCVLFERLCTLCGFEWRGIEKDDH